MKGFSVFFSQKIYSLSISGCLTETQNFEQHVYRSIRGKQTHQIKAMSSKEPLIQTAVSVVLSRLSFYQPLSLVLTFPQSWLPLISDGFFSTISPQNGWQLNFQSQQLSFLLPLSSSFTSPFITCSESPPAPGTDLDSHSNCQSSVGTENLL